MNLIKLQSESFRGYGNRPLPDPMDFYLSDLLSEITRERSADVFQVPSHTDARILLAFAERCASMAAREKDISWVERAVHAVGIAMQASDYRDVTIVVALICDATSRIATDHESVIIDIANTAGRQAAGEFQGFISRSPADKSIEEMGYTAVHGPDGFQYKRNW